MKITYKPPMQSTEENQLLPPGWYDFEVVQVYATDREGAPLVANNGNPYLKLVCSEVTTGVTLWHFLFLSTDDTAKISALIFACQLSAEEGQQIVIDANTFKGASFRARVESNKGFEGVYRNRITKVRPRKDPVDVGPLDVTARANESAATQLVEDQQDQAMDPEEEDEVPF